MGRPLMHLAAAFVLFAAAAFSSEKVPDPTLTPVPPSADQTALVREGTRLHDAQNYDGAIAKYKQVLAENRDEIGAMYELSFTYFAMKDYANALEVARHGVQYKSRTLPQFYVIIGNALDDSGKRQEAIEFYRDAIQRIPDYALLHYNLALALRRSGNNAGARPALQRALRLNPSHPSSHLLLGTIYKEAGYRVPAVMALSRFLEIEPGSPRASDTRAVLQELIAGNIKKGDQPNRINITMPSASKKDEGDFAAADMAISISIAAATTEKRKNQTAFATLVTTYRAMAQTMGNGPLGQGFAASYYAPYFMDLEKGGHVEAFVARAWEQGQVGGLADWLNENRAKNLAFMAWASAYRWPRE